jgi:hypothetical protein
MQMTRGFGNGSEKLRRVLIGFGKIGLLHSRHSVSSAVPSQDGFASIALRAGGSTVDYRCVRAGQFA